MAAAGPQWSTGLCDCCAEPGGAGLCFMTTCCGCFTAGKNGEYIQQTGGYWGNCLAALVPWLDMFCACDTAQKTMRKKTGGQEADGVCLAVESICCVPCVTCRTRREQLLMGGAPGYFPAKEQECAALMGSKRPIYAACAFD